LKPPIAIETALPNAAAPDGSGLPLWRHAYEEADGTVTIDLFGDGNGSGRLVISARSTDPSEALSMVRISLDGGVTPYLIPLAWSGETCRGEILVDTGEDVQA